MKSGKAKTIVIKAINSTDVVSEGFSFLLCIQFFIKQKKAPKEGL